MLFFYNIFIRLYYTAIWLASFFNPKAKQWIEGRRGVLNQLATKVQKGERWIWFHCASLGEFEQGRPLIETLRKQTNYKILLTFFSPSGYEIRKDYSTADHVCYLPLDTKKNAQQFLDILQPELVIFVKYEFWYHVLRQAQQREIPTILIAAVFREEQFFFKKSARLFKELVQSFTHLFVQDQSSLEVLQKNGITHGVLTGDTRVDRVLQIAKEGQQLPIVATFADNGKVLVAGSTWEKDEEILIRFINENPDNNWKYIIAPHQIGATHIQAIAKQLKVPFVRYSEAKGETMTSEKVLIIDNIGMLSKIYQYGQLAYIGGGFGVGIHNTLEPIAFEIPVLFGPKYHKFFEAKTLVREGGAFSIQNHEEFLTIFDQLEQKALYEKAVMKTQQFLNENKGATHRIMREITNYE